METNDVAVSPARKEMKIGHSEIVHYGSTEGVYPPYIRRTQAFLHLNQHSAVVLPGGYIQVPTPIDVEADAAWAVEPCLESLHVKPEKTWPPPQEVSANTN